MNIGIDCGSLSIDDDNLKTGVYRISLNFLKGLSKIDTKNKYFLYSFKPISKGILNLLNPNFINKTLKPVKGWSTFRLSVENAINPPDLFIGLNQSLPLLNAKRTILIVFDLAFEIFPECYPGIKNKLSRQTRSAVKKADKIIAISGATKKDLIRIYSADDKNITVSYPGVSNDFRPKNSVEVKNTLDKYKITKPYILFTGSYKPIKNIEGIIKAYVQLPEKLRRKYCLVSVGSDYWINNEIRDVMQENMNNNDFLNLGFVADKDLPSLYTGASVFLSPSLYEGFGLPLLEAMACGCPVIASKTGSMPEVLGKAGILVDPKNPKEIKNALEKVLTDNRLRRSMRIKSVNQSKQFTWESFAKNIYNIIQSST